MFHQKMIYQKLDGIINKMNSLIYDYSQRKIQTWLICIHV
jgi:hypothetical protein